jgi:hypothetical protein
MAEPTRRDVDQVLEESMQLFDRARVSVVAPVAPQRPTRILLALDGSLQDRLSFAIARQFRARFSCSVAVVDAREDTTSDELITAAAGELGATAVPKLPGHSFDQILAAVDQCHCDLLIAPSPYGRDLESVGPNSVGTVIDVLLARVPVPLLVVRKPYEPRGELFSQVRMFLTAENEAAPEAAAWATGLIAAKGLFELVLLIEREMRENIKALLESIAPEADVSADSLSHALAKTHVRLHRSLQKAATEVGFQYRLRLQIESTDAADAIADPPPGRLIVLALERRDHASQGTVQSRIRQSPHPVLIVCKD